MNTYITFHRQHDKIASSIHGRLHVWILFELLFELWENLLAIVRVQYDNMKGSPDTVNKKRKKLLHLWKKVPLFTMVAQEPQWQYRLP